MAHSYVRITRPPKGSFFLFGVRGVGKSTWAREHFPKAPRVDLLDDGRYQALLADPSLFGDEMRAVPRGTRVVVDEVQRLPTLLNEVHRQIEERDLRFVLLGSSARKPGHSSCSSSNSNPTACGREASSRLARLRRDPVHAYDLRTRPPMRTSWAR